MLYPPWPPPIHSTYIKQKIVRFGWTKKKWKQNSKSKHITMKISKMQREKKVWNLGLATLARTGLQTRWERNAPSHPHVNVGGRHEKAGIAASIQEGKKKKTGPSKGTRVFRRRAHINTHFRSSREWAREKSRRWETFPISCFFSFWQGDKIRKTKWDYQKKRVSRRKLVTGKFCVR